jgi:hypothetical protein
VRLHFATCQVHTKLTTPQSRDQSNTAHHFRSIIPGPRLHAPGALRQPYPGACNQPLHILPFLATSAKESDSSTRGSFRSSRKPQLQPQYSFMPWVFCLGLSGCGHRGIEPWSTALCPYPAHNSRAGRHWRLFASRSQTDRLLSLGPLDYRTAES